MTDDEIDAAIRAVVPAECFVPNAGARAIFRAGMREAARIITQECDRILATQTIPPRNSTDESINLQVRLCAVMLPGLADAIERAAGGEG